MVITRGVFVHYEEQPQLMHSEIESRAPMNQLCWDAYHQN